MKKILLIVALTGFTAAGSYAQNKDCSCNKKTAQTPLAKPMITPLVTPEQQDANCFLQLGMIPCNGVLSKNSEVFKYEPSASYTGYYPKTKAAIAAKAAHKTTPCAAKTNEMASKTVRKTAKDVPVAPCYSYRQHNIIVSDCPNVLYDREGWMLKDGSLNVNSDNTYMGYYPKPDETNTPKPVVPEDIEDQDDDYAPAQSPGDNLCFWNCN